MRLLGQQWRRLYWSRQWSGNTKCICVGKRCCCCRWEGKAKRTVEERWMDVNINVVRASAAAKTYKQFSELIKKGLKLNKTFIKESTTHREKLFSLHRVHCTLSIVDVQDLRVCARFKKFCLAKQYYNRTRTTRATQQKPLPFNIFIKSHNRSSPFIFVCNFFAFLQINIEKKNF